METKPLPPLIQGLPPIFACIRAIEAAIPCLSDWCQTTGFGETFRRDISALKACLDALEALREDNAESGVLSAGSAAWPIALEIVREWEGR